MIDTKTVSAGAVLATLAILSANSNGMDRPAPKAADPRSPASLKTNLSATAWVSRDAKSNYFFNAAIRGLGPRGANPAVRTLVFEGRPVATNTLVFSGTTATLTNLPVTVRSSYNTFFLHIGCSLASNVVDHEMFISATLYVNRLNPTNPPQLPELGSVTPDPSMPLFSPDPTFYRFDGSRPLEIRYGDVDPGVDASGVRIHAGDRSTNLPDINVTASFTCTAARAVLKPGAFFNLWSANPVLRIEIPEKGYATPAVFTLRYNIPPVPETTKAPYLAWINRHAFARGISVPVTLLGLNFGQATNLWFVDGATPSNRQLLRIRSKRTGVKVKGTRLDQMDFLLPPFRTGVFHFALDEQTQTQFPLLVVDAESLEVLDRVLARIRDRDGDGIITARELDVNGDGLPDPAAIVMPKRLEDTDGDGLKDEWDHEPLKPNTNYNPNASNAIEAMRHLGHVNPSRGSKDNAGPMVIIAPNSKQGASSP